MNPITSGDPVFGFGPRLPHFVNPQLTQWPVGTGLAYAPPMNLYEQQRSANHALPTVDCFFRPELNHNAGIHHHSSQQQFFRFGVAPPPNTYQSQNILRYGSVPRNAPQISQHLPLLHPHGAILQQNGYFDQTFLQHGTTLLHQDINLGQNKFPGKDIVLPQSTKLVDGQFLTNEHSLQQNVQPDKYILNEGSAQQHNKHNLRHGTLPSQNIEQFILRQKPALQQNIKMDRHAIRQHAKLKTKPPLEHCSMPQDLNIGPVQNVKATSLNKANTNQPVNSSKQQAMFKNKPQLGQNNSVQCSMPQDFNYQLIFNIQASDVNHNNPVNIEDSKSGLLQLSDGSNIIGHEGVDTSDNVHGFQLINIIKTEVPDTVIIKTEPSEISPECLENTTSSSDKLPELVNILTDNPDILIENAQNSQDIFVNGNFNGLPEITDTLMVNPENMDGIENMEEISDIPHSLSQVLETLAENQDGFCLNSTSLNEIVSSTCGKIVRKNKRRKGTAKTLSRKLNKILPLTKELSACSCEIGNLKTKSEGHFHCQTCNAVTKHAQSVIRHDAMVHSIVRPGLALYICPICDKVLIHVSEYARHISHHRNQAGLDSGAVDFIWAELEKCAVLGMKDAVEAVDELCWEEDFLSDANVDAVAKEIRRLREEENHMALSDVSDQHHMCLPDVIPETVESLPKLCAPNNDVTSQDRDSPTVVTQNNIPLSTFRAQNDVIMPTLNTQNDVILPSVNTQNDVHLPTVSTQNDVPLPTVNAPKDVTLPNVYSPNNVPFRKGEFRNTNTLNGEEESQNSEVTNISLNVDDTSQVEKLLSKQVIHGLNEITLMENNYIPDTNSHDFEFDHQKRQADGNFHCHLCFFYTTSQKSLERHKVAVHHLQYPQGVVYRCELCDMSTITKNQFKTHLLSLKHNLRVSRKEAGGSAIIDAVGIQKEGRFTYLFGKEVSNIITSRKSSSEDVGKRINRVRKRKVTSVEEIPNHTLKSRKEQLEPKLKPAVDDNPKLKYFQGDADVKSACMKANSCSNLDQPGSTACTENIRNVFQETDENMGPDKVKSFSMEVKSNGDLNPLVEQSENHNTEIVTQGMDFETSIQSMHVENHCEAIIKTVANTNEVLLETDENIKPEDVKSITMEANNNSDLGLLVQQNESSNANTETQQGMDFVSSVSGMHVKNQCEAIIKTVANNTEVFQENDENARPDKVESFILEANNKKSDPKPLCEQNLIQSMDVKNQHEPNKQNENCNTETKVRSMNNDGSLQGKPSGNQKDNTTVETVVNINEAFEKNNESINPNAEIGNTKSDKDKSFSTEAKSSCDLLVEQIGSRNGQNKTLSMDFDSSVQGIHVENQQEAIIDTVANSNEAMIVNDENTRPDNIKSFIMNENSNGDLKLTVEVNLIQAMHVKDSNTNKDINVLHLNTDKVLEECDEKDSNAGKVLEENDQYLSTDRVLQECDEKDSNTVKVLEEIDQYLNSEILKENDEKDSNTDKVCEENHQYLSTDKVVQENNKESNIDKVLEENNQYPCTDKVCQVHKKKDSSIEITSQHNNSHQSSSMNKTLEENNGDMAECLSEDDVCSNIDYSQDIYSDSSYLEGLSSSFSEFNDNDEEMSDCGHDDQDSLCQKKIVDEDTCGNMLNQQTKDNDFEDALYDASEEPTTSVVSGRLCVTSDNKDTICSKSTCHETLVEDAMCLVGSQKINGSSQDSEDLDKEKNEAQWPEPIVEESPSVGSKKICEPNDHDEEGQINESQFHDPLVESQWPEPIGEESANVGSKKISQPNEDEEEGQTNESQFFHDTLVDESIVVPRYHGKENITNHSKYGETATSKVHYVECKRSSPVVCALTDISVLHNVKGMSKVSKSVDSILCKPIDSIINKPVVESVTNVLQLHEAVLNSHMSKYGHGICGANVSEFELSNACNSLQTVKYAIANAQNTVANAQTTVANAQTNVANAQTTVANAHNTNLELPNVGNSVNTVSKFSENVSADVLSKCAKDVSELCNAKNIVEPESHFMKWYIRPEEHAVLKGE